MCSELFEFGSWAAFPLEGLISPFPFTLPGLLKKLPHLKSDSKNHSTRDLVEIASKCNAEVDLFPFPENFLEDNRAIQDNSPS